MAADVTVVGAGIVGLATVFALRERGATVCVYERGVPGNGQSGGDSRIFRHLHDDPRLVALAVEARAGWRRWEERFGVELLRADGVVALGPSAQPRASLLADAGLPVAAVDLHDALPFARPRATSALVDEAAGVLRTRAAIAALASGVHLVADEVLAVRPTGRDTVEVRTGGLTAEHHRVVVCAGRATAELAAAAGVDIPLNTSTHVRHSYALRDGAPDRVPCLLDGDHGAYGDPLPGNAVFATGVGDPQPTGLADEARRVDAYVAEHLPGLDPVAVGVRHCWVTELPWHHDAFAAWPAGGALFFAGNNLFKHAPVLGERLAAAALGDTAAVGDLAPERRLGAPPRASEAPSVASSPA